MGALKHKPEAAYCEAKHNKKYLGLIYNTKGHMTKHSKVGGLVQNELYICIACDFDLI